jgi:DNA-binding NarL/FixJ family response regulator
LRFCYASARDILRLFLPVHLPHHGALPSWKPGSHVVVPRYPAHFRKSRIPKRFCAPVSPFCGILEMLIEVLVVDDHCVVRDGLVILLKEQPDIRVVGSVGDGEGAIKEAQRLSPHVVVMDVSMPDMDGIAATRAIVGASPDIRVVMLSVHESLGVALQALEAGARGYLTKKSAAAELLKAVRAVAGGRRYLGDGLADDGAGGLHEHGGRPEALRSLTDTEREILRLTVEGRSNAEMAKILSLSPRTVETYRLLMMRKLDLKGLPALVKFAIREGITSLE